MADLLEELALSGDVYRIGSEDFLELVEDQQFAIGFGIQILIQRQILEIRAPSLELQRIHQAEDVAIGWSVRRRSCIHANHLAHGEAALPHGGNQSGLQQRAFARARGRI